MAKTGRLTVGPTLNLKFLTQYPGLVLQKDPSLTEVHVSTSVCLVHVVFFLLADKDRTCTYNSYKSCSHKWPYPSKGTVFQGGSSVVVLFFCFGVRVSVTFHLNF